MKKKKLNIYQDKSKEDKKFIPSLEMPKEVKKRNFTPSLEMSKEVKKRNFTPSLEMPKEVKKRNFIPTLEMLKENKRDFIPGYDSKNKIEPLKLKPNFTPKNKIEQPQLKLNYKPQNKIKPHKFKPNYTPKNKIEFPQLSPNYQPKNKIQLPILKAYDTPKHKINVINSIQDIKDEKLNPNQLKDEIRNFNWKNVSDDWVIKYNNKELQLDPTKDPSKDNPLYSNKDWLNTVYNNESWNLNDTQLAKICMVDQRTINRWRKKYCILTKPKYIKQNLYFDGKNKECGHCHEIKSYSEFIFRRKNDLLYPKSTCKKCDDAKKQIFALNNKIKVMENIYGGELGSKCQKCNNNEKKLPALEFHHTDPSIKKTSWHSRMYKNWEKTMHLLEKEKVMILCRNCHTKERSNTYNKYENIIQGGKFDINSSNEEINKYLNEKLSQPIRKNILNQILYHIKKRVVFNSLYDGKCVGCGEITTLNNLHSLNLHNREKSNHDKARLWIKIRKMEPKQIETELRKNNCVILCGNCYRMIDFIQFKNQHEKIIKSEYWNQIKSYFEPFEKKVKNFEFPEGNKGELRLENDLNNPEKALNICEDERKTKLELQDPSIVHQKDVGEIIKQTLKRVDFNNSTEDEKNFIEPLNNKDLEKLPNIEYRYGEAWMKYLLHIAKLTEQKIIVRTKDVAESVGVITRNVRKNLVKLINEELITISGEYNNRHIILSEKGLKALHNIKKIKNLPKN